MNDFVKLYHVTNSPNIASIFKNGLRPMGCRGLGSPVHLKRKRKLYLTDSLKYIKIMAEDISTWENYTILKVCIKKKNLTLIWWKGKGYREWTTTETISPENISIFSERKTWRHE